MDSNPFSLRAWPTEASGKTSLPYLISRIIEQKGSFRHVTEAELAEDISALEAGQSIEVAEDGDGSQLEDDGPSSQTTREALMVARDAMLKSVGQAQMEATYSRDFVSLVLSKDNPRQAETTISPFLRDRVPLGTLGRERVQLAQPTDQQIRNDNLVATGLKLQSLNASADSLLRTATKLKEEMEREARYWGDVVAIKEKGWAICRLPRERHTLGTRYGFLESAPEYKDRGLAALRRDKSGGIDLDLGPGSKNEQSLRVRVVEHGRTLATSTPSKVQDERDENIDTRLIEARNSIFDEELYNQMYSEARSLANRGVKCTSKGITLPLGDDKVVLFDMISADASEMVEDITEYDTNHDKLPDLMLTASRILLSHAHRESYNMRCKVPPPVTEKPPPRASYPILRPLLTQLDHRSALRMLQELQAGLQKIAEAAGFHLRVLPPSNDSYFSKSLATGPTSSRPFVETLVGSLSAPLQTSLVMELGSTPSRLEVSLRTHTMSTEYKVVRDACPPSSPLANVPRETVLATFAELEDVLSHLILLDLVYAVELHAGKSGWAISSAHAGELSTEPDTNGVYQTLTLDLDRNRLVMMWMDTEGGEGRTEWTRDGKAGDGGLLENFEKLRSRVEGS